MKREQSRRKTDAGRRTTDANRQTADKERTKNRRGTDGEKANRREEE
jgi:hypothetical protein